MMRVGYQERCDALLRALSTTPLDAECAALCARIVADTTRDGIYSHGLHMFPRLIIMMRSGIVDPTRHPARTWSLTWPCRSSPTGHSRRTGGDRSCCPSWEDSIETAS